MLLAIRKSILNILIKHPHDFVLNLSIMACYRCGRKGHFASNCFARTSVEGDYLDDSGDSDEDDSGDSDEDDRYCYSPKKKARLSTSRHQSAAETNSHVVSSVSGVYVLQTRNGLFYVGKSNNINARIQEHRSGLGAACLDGSSFQVVTHLLTSGNTADLESWERNETLQRMMVHGIENVRGWMFTSKNLSDKDRENAFTQICEKFELCRRCGRNSHFADRCFAKTRDVWAGREIV